MPSVVGVCALPDDSERMKRKQFKSSDMKTVIVSKQTFEEITNHGHGVPRTEDRYIQEGVKVGKEYFKRQCLGL